MSAPRSTRVRRVVMASLIGLALAGAAGPVAAHGPDPLVGGGLWVQDQTVRFRWRSGAEPPTAIKTAIREAADDSNAYKSSRAATFAYDSAGPSLIGYGTGTCGVNGIGCFTRSAPDSFTMWLREHGRVYDWGVLRWCQMQSTPTNGCYDAETITLDEFGHVEVLGHHVNYADDRDYTDAVVQTYSRTRPSTGYDMHRYGSCDVATLQMQYDVSLASSPLSSCLDMATTLTIGVNDAQLRYAETATFTSVLRVASDSSYVKLSGNALSTRTVRLQRRPLGSTTWTTLATMTPTTPTGSYVAAVRLYATADFRAVFSASSTEGLRGDTSPIIRVTVQPCTYDCPLPYAQP
ncbi:MAG TPA: hypothetical protein VFJ80_06095 [Candidatus Limnocylindrales bacterium]|nr:hypothetical protein [Candidatus Limnocylindrales bacterium]